MTGGKKTTKKENKKAQDIQLEIIGLVQELCHFLVERNREYLNMP